MQFRILEKTKDEIGVCLRCLEKNGSAEQYIQTCAKAGVVAFFISILLFGLFSKDLHNAAAISAVIGFLCFVFALQMPKNEMRARAKKIEKDLPFALMQLSVGLNIGMPFDAALMEVARGEYGEFSHMLGKSMRAAKKSGGSVPGALIEMASKARSRQLTRSCAQLISVYEQGSSTNPGEGVRRMALEQLSRQKSDAKEFSGKVAVFSLAFIVVSAIVPALFLAFVVVGGSFIEIPFTALEVLAIVALGFPLLDIAMLLYIRSLTPEFLKG